MCVSPNRIMKTSKLYNQAEMVLWNLAGTSTKTERTSKSMGFVLKKQRLFLKVYTSQALIPEIITMNAVKQKSGKLPLEYLETEWCW